MGSSLSQRHSVGPDPASRWCPDPGVGAARTFLPGNHPESPSFADQSLVGTIARTTIVAVGRRFGLFGCVLCSRRQGAIGCSPPATCWNALPAHASVPPFRARHRHDVAVILASISILQWTLQSTRRHRDSNPRHGRDRAVCSTGLHHGGSIALEGFEPSSRTPRARMIGQTTPQGWMRLDISVLSINGNSLDHELPESVRI